MAPFAASYAADKPKEEKTTSDSVNETLTDAWASFKQGAKEAWDGTVKAFDDMTRKSQTDIVLPKALPGAVSAKSLIGTPIENAKEGRVGSISDVVLGNDSRVDAIVVSDGGFLGINNAQIAVKPSLISLRRDEKGALKARTNVTESQLDSASSAAFTTRIEAMKEDFKKPEVKTASRLMKASVVGPDGKEVGKVDDVLLSPVGEARYALIATGGTMGVGTKVVAVPISAVTFTRSDQPLKTTMTAAELGKLAPVRSQASAT
jgi:sporulation protein YlmC with PRC-barrel domain